MEAFRLDIEQDNPMIEQILSDSAYRVELYKLRIRGSKRYSKVIFFFPIMGLDSFEGFYRELPTFCIAQDPLFSDQWFANGEEVESLYNSLNEIEWEYEEIRIR